MAKTPHILTATQEKVLEIVSRDRYLCNNFYFTGGTPLAAFYLYHRISEDIDLFSEQEVDLLAIRVLVGKFQKLLKIRKVDYRQFLGLHSFQLYFTQKNILKIDFNYYPFPRIEQGKKYNNLSVDSVFDIAVNKVHTIAMKPRARDFIDIYFIVREKKYDLRELLMQAKAKFDWHIDPVQLGSRLLTATQVADYPRMVKPINHREWQEFFVAEAKKLKKEIFE